MGALRSGSELSKLNWYLEGGANTRLSRPACPEVGPVWLGGSFTHAVGRGGPLGRLAGEPGGAAGAYGECLEDDGEHAPDADEVLVPLGAQRGRLDRRRDLSGPGQGPVPCLGCRLAVRARDPARPGETRPIAEPFRGAIA